MNSLATESETALRTPEDKRMKVGLAFQGGSFLAGSVATGVVEAIVEKGLFKPTAMDLADGKKHNIMAFSGTSAGGLVATLCWGLRLQDQMAKAPAMLERLWLYNASGIIPNEEVGDLVREFERLARLNPIYDHLANALRTPWLRSRFWEWIDECIPLQEFVDTLCHRRDIFATLTDTSPAGQKAREALAKPDETLPRLALGSTDVLNGDIVTFTDQHVVDAIVDAFVHPADPGLGVDARAARARDVGRETLKLMMSASGSLDWINGMTTISEGPFKGTYLDGAWGSDPPISVMIDFRVREIWVFEIFPKYRASVPKTFPEREDRKEELWQNSLVEQECRFINKVTEWLESGRMHRGSYQGDHGDYQPVTARRMPMTLDFTPGARLVNSESFLKDKMGYGYQSARHFMDAIPIA